MFEDITVSNSNFRDVYQGVYTQGVKNLYVEDSSFALTGHNAIAVQNGNNNTFSGEINITGNTFADIGNRPIRFGNGNNANILVSDNDFGNCTNSYNEFLAAGTLTGCKMEFVSNLYKGAVITEPEITTEAGADWIVKIPQ